MSKISIVKGDDRKENIKKALEIIEKDIDKAIKIKGLKQLFIKTNTIDTNFPLACTHVDALDSVLDFFYDKFDKIIVGDNSFVFTKNKGAIYKKILSKYPKIKFSDLTEFETQYIEFMKLNKKIINSKVSLLPKKSFTISLALPKTHDTFVYTGCLKNMFGCVIKDRNALHALSLYERIFLTKYVKSNKLKWFNLVNVIKKTMPDLCILDAYEGMEGDGPIFGTKVKLKVAMCSLDGIALDKFASKIFGFGYVPYLSMLNNNFDIEIIKDGFKDISEIRKNFKLHYKNKYQIMTNVDLFIPRVDIFLIISVLKRFYRLKDKIIEKINY